MDSIVRRDLPRSAACSNDLLAPALLEQAVDKKQPIHATRLHSPSYLETAWNQRIVGRDDRAIPSMAIVSKYQCVPVPGQTLHDSKSRHT